MGISYFLPRMVGLSIASELMLTGRFIEGERALRCNLLSELYDTQVLDNEIDAYCTYVHVCIHAGRARGRRAGARQ